MTPTPVLMGPDVSSYQGQPDWSAVAAAGRSFAWTKATEGTGYVNPTFAHNWPGIKQAGLIRGAYHFGRPDQNAPEAEAEFFIATIGDPRPTDLVALDLEVGAGNLLDWALAWLRRATSALGFKPLLYSGRWFLDAHGVEANAQLAGYGLWLSGYGTDAPPLPPGWTTLAMWQFTNSASVPGIAGPCDESYFFGTSEQLAAYGKPAPAGQLAPPDGTIQIAKRTLNQVITQASVIGDMTYPDGCDMDSPAPNQTVSRRIFQRQLVQELKSLLGA